MDDKLYIAICDSYEYEFRGAIKAGNLHDVEIMIFPSLCARGRIDRKRWADFFNSNHFSKGNLVVIAGETCDFFRHYSEELQEARVITRENCFYHLLGKSAVDGFISQGAYLVTAGWLMNWSEYIECWGFRADLLQQFFRDFAQKIIILDTGANEQCKEHADQFSQKAGIPYEIHVADPMQLQLFVKKIVFEWRLGKKKNRKSP